MQDSASHLVMLRRHVERVRVALETLAAEGRWPALGSFPQRGGAQVAALLGAYLVDRGLQGFESVRGERGQRDDDSLEVHHWLRSGPLVLDIAADRFEDAPQPLIVASQSPWHESTFRLERAPEPADFRVYTGPGLEHVMFAELLQRLPA